MGLRGNSWGPMGTKFPLKGVPKVKEVLAKNVPYVHESPQN
jgi:hypothetical protein